MIFIKHGYGADTLPPDGVQIIDMQMHPMQSDGPVQGVTALPPVSHTPLLLIAGVAAYFFLKR